MQTIQCVLIQKINKYVDFLEKKLILNIRYDSFIKFGLVKSLKCKFI